MRRVFVGGLLAGLMASSTLAAPSVDPEGNVVQELVVTARIRGPAWWWVSSPTSTVYILGSPGALPKGLKWDSAAMAHHLDGANELIGPPRVSVGLRDIFTLISLRGHFRSKSPMEDSLKPALRARFLTDRAKLTKDPRAYSNWTSLAAGLLMVADFRRQARLDLSEPQATVDRLARSKGVKVVPAGIYKAVSVFRAAETGLAISGPACMADALDEVEAGGERIRVAGEGWARGDVGAALTAQRGYEKCVNSLPEGADVITRSMNDSTATIAQALTKSGHSVAVVNLRSLLAQGGVLQRLKAQGFKVVTPDQ